MRHSDSVNLGSIPGSATDLRDDLVQVVALRCASVSPLNLWLTCPLRLKAFEGRNCLLLGVRTAPGTTAASHDLAS